MTLASQIRSDLTQIMADWGDSAVYNGGATINGIFDNEYFSLTMGQGDVSSAKPAFVCKTSDVASAAKTDTLVITSALYGITSVSYSVSHVETAPPDLGPGLTRFVLKK